MIVVVIVVVVDRCCSRIMNGSSLLIESNPWSQGRLLALEDCVHYPLPQYRRPQCMEPYAYVYVYNRMASLDRGQLETSSRSL